jgi:nucleoside-diphosphate-sugar epimerase
MPKIAVLGGTGYLASLLKNQNNKRKNKYIFFSRKKKSMRYINYVSFIKYFNILYNFDYIIYLLGPNQKQLLKNKSLAKKKNEILSNICNLCLKNNIKLIYLSSMQIYEGYGKKNIFINSKINLKNFYSKSHYDSEKIILKKFLNHKNMFIILRVGNVFGFKKYVNLKEIKNNLIHSICFSALDKKKIIIKNGSIQRSFVPSKIFVQVINTIIEKNFFKNSIINIFYKNFSLKDIAKIVQKRFKLIFNLTIDIVIKQYNYQKIFKVYDNHPFKFISENKKIYFEIDQIIKKYKKIKTYSLI